MIYTEEAGNFWMLLRRDGCYWHGKIAQRSTQVSFVSRRATIWTRITGGWYHKNGRNFNPTGISPRYFKRQHGIVLQWVSDQWPLHHRMVFPWYFTFLCIFTHSLFFSALQVRGCKTLLRCVVLFLKRCFSACFSPKKLDGFPPDFESSIGFRIFKMSWL